MKFPESILRVFVIFATGVAAAAALHAPLAHSEEFLDPEVAFKFAARAIDAGTLELNIRIADGYYLYREKFRFSADPATLKIGAPELPKGKEKVDEFFGKVETYRGDLKIRLPISGSAGPGGRIKLKTGYQGCADAGICYPPLERMIELTLAGGAPTVPGGGLAALTRAGQGSATDALASNAPKMNTPAAPSMAPAIDLPQAALRYGARSVPDGEQSRIAKLLRGGDFWAIVLAFLGIGLLLAFTPCVLPMVPIIAGIIAGEGHRITRSRSFLLSLSYVAGMAITYTAAGIAAGLSGSLLSNALQNVWVLGAFALIFVLLAMSMFGFYELQLPSALQTRLSDASNRIGGGKMSGSFVMGALSAMIVGPCVAAPLAGALLYIGQTHDLVLGGSALFAMAIGMGVPLLLVGMSAGALLPRAGAWMDAVKRFFGVLLLALAIWVVSPLLPTVAVMLASSALLIVSAIFLHAMDPLPPHAHGAHRFWKGVGVIAMVAGIALLIGALSGSRDILQPLSGLRLAGASSSPAQSVNPQPVAFERIKTVADLDLRIASAKRPVMLDFYADWCVSCKEMERYTFSDPQVQARFAGMLLLQADVTANDDADQALLRRFSLFGPPGIIFFDARGGELDDARTVGFLEADRFLKTLAYVAGS